MDVFDFSLLQTLKRNNNNTNGTWCLGDLVPISIVVLLTFYISIPIFFNRNNLYLYEYESKKHKQNKL